MNRTREVIEKNEEQFSEFEYYFQIIDVVEKNLITMPDIAIESCKSLIEGISKTVLRGLGIAYNDRGRNADSPYALFKKATQKLQDYVLVDIEFIQSTSGIIERMTKLRNERGDISHGKAAPKVEQSDKQLAQFIAHITDGIVGYVLEKYFEVNIPDQPITRYEENEEFNIFLDESNPVQGVSFSKALFDQDPISYQEQLNNFLSEKQEEREL